MPPRTEFSPVGRGLPGDDSQLILRPRHGRLGASRPLKGATTVKIFIAAAVITAALIASPAQAVEIFTVPGIRTGILVVYHVNCSRLQPLARIKLETAMEENSTAVFENATIADKYRKEIGSAKFCKRIHERFPVMTG